MSPVRYEMGHYIPEEDILQSHRCEDFQSYKQSVNCHSRMNTEYNPGEKS
jgi:hypothetical protein